MLAFAVAVLAKMGLSEDMARRFAAPFLILAGAIVALGLYQTWDYFNDQAAVREYQRKVEEQTAKARAKAEDERVADAIANATSEEELHNAVDSAPGGVLSPAAHALACERLRRHGRVPESCRPEGGD